MLVEMVSKSGIYIFLYLRMVIIEIFPRLTLPLSMWMSSAGGRPKLFNLKKNCNSSIHRYIWIQYAECVKMSTDNPGIGAVVLEVAP